MSYQFYKILHFVGLATVLTSLCLRMGASEDGMKRATGIAHGVGMLVMLVGGFGLIARLGLPSFPGWIWAKLVLWILLGATMALVIRKKSPVAIWVGLVTITGLGAYMALYKPF